MQVRRRHWTLALAGAVLVHAGVAAAILWQPPKSGAVSAGVGGIEISLDPAGGAPGTVAQPADRAEEADAAIPPERAPTTPPPEESTVSPTPPNPVDAAPVEQVATELPPIETAKPLLVEESVVQPIEPVATPADSIPVATTSTLTEVTQAPPPEAAPATAASVPPPPTPKPRPAKPQQTVAVLEPTTVPQTTPVSAPSPAPPTADTTVPQPQQVARAAPPPIGAGGRAGPQARPDTGQADTASSGGGLPGTTADYVALLQAWLEKHKEYPRRARIRRQEGTALLYFLMDRDGSVIEYRVQRSSGHTLLDREVSAMIERAQPLPRVPDDMPQARLEIIVPVQFFLR